jgi:hypothetical protein
LHSLQNLKIAGGVRLGSLVKASMACGKTVNRVFRESSIPARWQPPAAPSPALVQIDRAD